MRRVVLIFGIPGAGKTTVVREAIKNTEWKVFNYGDYMMKVLEKNGYDRDSIRHELSLDEYRELQGKALESLLSDIKNYERVIIDTHAIVYLPKYGYLPGVPFSNLSRINPDSIVLIRARPEEIMKRRIKDYYERGRARDIDMEVLRRELKMELMYSTSYSIIAGCPLSIIDNNENRLYEAVLKLRKILQNL